MWWQYKLIEKTAEKVVYAYSRESKKLDGLVEYWFATEERVMVRPCAADAGSKLGERCALEHLGHLIREDFPEERQVATG